MRTTSYNVVRIFVYMVILLVTLGPFEQIDASRTGSTSQCTTDNNGNSLLFECFT